jgi:hypothetical protein
LKLDDLGLTPNQSKRWQLEARIPEDLFCDHVRQTCEDGKELTSASLMRLAQSLKGKSSGRNGAGNRKGHAVHQHGLSGNGESAIGRAEQGNNHFPTCTFGEVLSELHNHHQVLDGILRPLYIGETLSLRPAELRMLRYLLSETGGLLAQLEQIEAGVPVCTCYEERQAV